LFKGFSSFKIKSQQDPILDSYLNQFFSGKRVFYLLETCFPIDIVLCYSIQQANDLMVMEKGQGSLPNIKKSPRQETI